MTEYTVRIKTRRDLPDDVVVEHIAYGLQGIVDPERKRASRGVTVEMVEVKRARSHPFEGPVVFDDVEDETYASPKASKITVGGFTGRVAGTGVYLFNEKGVMNMVSAAIGEDFPHLSELFRAKGAPQPPAEGDWQLTDDDRVGEDL